MALTTVPPLLLQSGLIQRTVARLDTQAAVTPTAGTLLPLDDTIPQITEGAEFLTCLITPKSASSILKVRYQGFLTSSTVSWVIGAIFRDTTPDALAAAHGVVATAGHGFLMIAEGEVVAGSTTSTTFRVRVGAPATGPTIYVGGALGTAGHPRLTVEEWLIPA